MPSRIDTELSSSFYGDLRDTKIQSVREFGARLAGPSLPTFSTVDEEAITLAEDTYGSLCEAGLEDADPVKLYRTSPRCRSVLHDDDAP